MLDRPLTKRELEILKLLANADRSPNDCSPDASTLPDRQLQVKHRHAEDPLLNGNLGPVPKPLNRVGKVSDNPTHHRDGKRQP